MPITKKEAVDAVLAMKDSGMRFFPPGDSAIALIAGHLMRFVDTLEHLTWLTDKVIKEEREWPTIAGLRETFKHRYRPIDYCPSE